MFYVPSLYSIINSKYYSTNSQSFAIALCLKCYCIWFQSRHDQFPVMEVCLFALSKIQSQILSLSFRQQFIRGKGGGSFFCSLYFSLLSFHVFSWTYGWSLQHTRIANAIWHFILVHNARDKQFILVHNAWHNTFI